MNKLSTKFRSKLNPLLREYEHNKRLVKEETLTLLRVEEELSAVEEAQSLVQLAAEEVQNTIHSRLASIVSKSLKAVFLDKAYEFLLRFEKKRNKTEASLIFRRGEMELERPTDEAGVGQIDIAALALRLACLTLVRPKVRRLLVLDEPGKNIHGTENRKRAASLLQALSKEFGFQIILSTGMEWLQIGKVIHIGEKK